MDKLLIPHMDKTMAATQAMDKANQVIHNLTVVMRIKSRAHMASSLTITRDRKTRNHQEGKESVKAQRLCWVMEITLWVLNRFHHQILALHIFFQKSFA